MVRDTGSKIELMNMKAYATVHMFNSPIFISSILKILEGHFKEILFLGDFFWMDLKNLYRSEKSNCQFTKDTQVSYKCRFLNIV